MEFVAPQSLVEIEPLAFLKCRQLTSVRLNEGLERVEESCFWMTCIKQLELPLRWVGKLATDYAPLTEVVLPDWMESVPERLFQWRDIKRVIVPSSVRRIEAHAFYNCAYLHEIVFADKSRLEWIGPMAFASSGIAEFVAPPSLRVIRELAFVDCVCLTKLKLNTGLRVLGFETEDENGENGAFMGSAIRSVVVPSTVRRIGNYCFYNCRSLAEVTLSRGLEEIGKKSFN